MFSEQEFKSYTAEIERIVGAKNFKEISKTPVFSLRSSNLLADNYLQAKIIKLYVEYYFFLYANVWEHIQHLKLGTFLLVR